jgi:hypothetical protein
MIGAELADALFLADHPGWSWSDLQSAPVDVVADLKAVERARQAVAKAELERWQRSRR